MLGGTASMANSSAPQPPPGAHLAAAASQVSPAAQSAETLQLPIAMQSFVELQTSPAAQAALHPESPPSPPVPPALPPTPPEPPEFAEPPNSAPSAVSSPPQPVEAVASSQATAAISFLI